LNIEGYCDSNWATYANDKKSTSGYCIFVGGNLVAWKNKKQHVVARSTAEAEYRAMALSVAEMIWERSILVELKMNQWAQMNLWCDDKSTINIANLVQHNITKHVKIDKFFIKEKPNSELLELGHVATKEQMADYLTEGFNSLNLTRLCDKIGLMDISYPS
jgi:hypothetical protein